MQLRLLSSFLYVSASTFDYVKNIKITFFELLLREMASGRHLSEKLNDGGFRKTLTLEVEIFLGEK